MARLIFINMLMILTAVASFVSRCEHKSTAGMQVIRLVASFFPVMVLTDASRNKRIAGGRWVRDPFRYPWIVSINVRYRGENRSGKPFGLKKRCTGSFIDIYGSILTAGHCLRKRMYYNEEGSYVKLSNATISWGSTSPLPYRRMGGTAVIQESNIRRFKRQGLERRKGKIDIALIFIQQFEETPMTSDPNVIPRVRPIELATVNESIQPGISDGTLLGFGAQPYTFNETAVRYVKDNPLREISMHYSGYFRKVCGVRVNPFTRARLLFGARAIIDQPTDNAAQFAPMYRGPCKGDSGGPYMVPENGQEKLRGISVQIICGTKGICHKFNDSSTFIDVNHKRVRDWLTKELQERYNLMKVEVSTIPMTDMPALAHHRHVRGHL